ncbi:hypothetical protein D3C75_1072840 [compost metagenome]
MLTPRPSSFSSPGSIRLRPLEPVATIMALDSYMPSAVKTILVSPSRSTAVIEVVSKVAPKLLA